MDKPAPKKPVFSTKDLPSSSDKDFEAPLKYRKKLKGKSQRLKKPVSRKPEPSPILETKITKAPQKSEKEKIESVPEILDPATERILTFFQLKESFELNYISDMSYFLNCSGITEENYDQIMSKREKFQAYPYYMKHTIFQEDEEMQQIRNCSFETRLQAAYENLDKGNKAFKSERFPEALASYERALGGFIWLEMTEPDASNPEYAEYKKSIVRIIAHMKKQKESGQEVDHIYNNLELEKNHKFLFQPITDENLIAHMDLLTSLEGARKKLLDNCLLAIYLNISACYLKENNFYEALTALEDALKINEKNSILYFRRSQALAYNKDSHLEDLYQAKIDLFQSREIMLYENKSNGKSKNVVKNPNDEKILIDYYKYLEERITERKKYEKIIIAGLMQQAKDTKNLPKDTKPLKSEEIPEYENILDMVGRYVRILEIYKEYKEEEKMKQYLKAYLEVKSVLSEMEFYLSIDFEDTEENDVVTELAKELKISLKKNSQIINILNVIKMTKAQDVFKRANIKTDLLTNFSLNGLKNGHENEEEEDDKEKKHKIKWDYKDLMTWEGIKRVLILGAIFWLFYYLNCNTAMFNRYLFNSSVNAEIEKT